MLLITLLATYGSVCGDIHMNIELHSLSTGHSARQNLRKANIVRNFLLNLSMMLYVLRIPLLGLIFRKSI